MKKLIIKMKDGRVNKYKCTPAFAFYVHMHGIENIKKILYGNWFFKRVLFTEKDYEANLKVSY